mmetsp:Transcript_15676/g.27487  ORF Transcript_15676/g.27487 Transcript_15676/m.27487 type:complete len:123 (-) Transcript_15676:158-526(-)
MGRFANFLNKIQFKPEVWPVVGAVCCGLISATYFSYNKLFLDGSVITNKNIRLMELGEQVEAKPWHVTDMKDSTKFSTRVFDKHEPNITAMYNSPEYLRRERERIEKFNSAQELLGKSKAAH